MKRLLAFCFVISFISSLFAYDVCLNGVYYNLGSEASVTSGGAGVLYSGTIVIPDSISYGGTNYAVEAISDSAFFGCTSLTKVICGSNVFEVGTSAFENCSALDTIVFTGQLQNIMKHAFKNSGLSHIYSYSSVVPTLEYDNYDSIFGGIAKSSCFMHTPRSFKENYLSSSMVWTFFRFLHLQGTNSTRWYYDGVKVVNDGTIRGDCYHGNLTVPSFYFKTITISFRPTFKKILVTTIGDSAFYNCTNLESISFSDTLNYIGDFAFYNSGLKEIVIGDSVRKIGKNAFARNKYLKRAIIGTGIDTMTKRMFQNCDSLKEVVLSENTKFIDTLCFGMCKQVESFVCKAITPPNLSDNTTFMRTFGGINKNTCVLYVPAEAISDYKSHGVWGQFTKILPIGTVLVDGLIYELDGVNNTAKVVGYEVDEITIPSAITINSTEYSVTTLGAKVFTDAELTSFVFAENSNVEVIEDSCFTGATITSIVIPNSVSTIGDYALYGIKDIELGSGVNSLGRRVLCADSVIRIVVDPANSVYDSRNNCNAVVETATNTLMYGCRNSVIVDGIEVIGASAFENCTALNEINIPNSVKMIDDRAFANSAIGLTRIIIGTGLETIDTEAFVDCGAGTLAAITCKAQNPPVCISSVFEDNFTAGLNTTCKLNVRYSALEQYKTADVWKEFADIEAFDAPTAVDEVTINKIWSDKGTIYSTDEFVIYDVLGRDVTENNGKLKGIYIVKTVNGTQKVTVK